MTLNPGWSLLIFRQHMQLDVAEIVYVCELIVMEFDITIYSEPIDPNPPICNLYVFYM